MKATFLKLSILWLFCDCITALIIPEELPTILSLIYSNIPPIKKGTDSRLGVGFRLGEHADFQILVELGPQTETDPIGNADAKRRRMATLDAAMRGELGPWAQSVAKYQTQLRIQKELEKMKQLNDKLLRIKLENGDKVDHKKITSDDWITKWSKDVSGRDDKVVTTKFQPVEAITLNVKNDKRAEKRVTSGENASENLESQMVGLKKLYKPQATR